MARLQTKLAAACLFCGVAGGFQQRLTPGARHQFPRKRSWALAAAPPYTNGGGEGAETNGAGTGAATAAPATALPPRLPMPGSDEDDPKSRRQPSLHYLDSLPVFGGEVQGIPMLRAAERIRSDDWFYILVTLPRSKILRRISSHIIAATVWSVAVVATEPILMSYQLAPLSPTMHGLLGGMLSILLAFRMNQSYDRFWTSANSWEDAAGNIRNMALLLSTSLQREEDEELVSGLMRCLAAYPVALKQYLRGERRLEDFRPLLSRDEVDELRCAENMPLALCQRASLLIAPLRVDDPNLYFFLQAPLRELILIIGQCERMVRTPVPLSYVRHTSRFVSIFTLTLPFVLVGNMSPYLVPVAVGSVSWSLFGIEEIGHLIEEPFGAQPEAREGEEEESGARSSSAEEKAFRPWYAGVPSKVRPEILPLDRYCDLVRRDLTERYLMRRAALERSGGGGRGGGGQNGADAGKRTGTAAAQAAAQAAAAAAAAQAESGLVEV